MNGKAKTITKVDDLEPELNMSRQEILNTIDKWVSEGSEWVIDRIDSHYLNVTLYKPLNGSSYVELPTELRNPKKGLINIKNKDDESFRWCHIRHLNPQTEHPERIKKKDKKMINELNYDGIDFPLSQKHYNKVEKQNSMRINVPVPKIKELNKALKNHAKSYRIEIQDYLNPLNHFTKTKAFIESHLESLLKHMKGFKFIETLEVMFVKKITTDSINKTASLIYKKTFFNGKAKTSTKPNDIEPELNMSRQEILNVIEEWVSESSGWAINHIDSHYINVNLYKPLNGSSYMELPMELKNPKKGLINIKNKDDECFRWCHIRHLNPQTEHPERIKK